MVVANIIPMTARPANLRIILPICWLSASLGSALVLLGTSRYGVGIDTDSVTYLSVTHSLLDGNGFRVYNGTPFVSQPPLYPLILALLVHAGFDAATAARYLNATIFGAIAALSTWWLLKHVRLPGLILMGSAATVFSRPLLGVSVFALSEPLFVLLVLLSLYFLSVHVSCGRASALLLCLFFAILACLTRYVGIAVALTGCLILLRKRDSPAARIRSAGVFLVIALLPLGVWCARNYALTSTLLGLRAPSAVPIRVHLITAMASVSAWLLPDAIPTVLRVGALACTAVLLPCVIRRRYEHQNAPSARRPLDLTPVLPGIWFVPVFSFCSLLAAAHVAMDLLDDRLLSPLFVPSLLITCFFIDRLEQWLDPAASERLRKYLLLAFGLWLCYPLMWTFNRVLSSRETGASALTNHVGFSRERWAHSALIAYIRTHRLNGIVYSNYPDPIYLFTGITTIQTPPKFRYNSRQRLSRSIIQFRKTIDRHRGAYLIWFDDPTRPFLYTLDELRSVVPMRMLVRCSDGAIYRVDVHDLPRHTGRRRTIRPSAQELSQRRSSDERGTETNRFAAGERHASGKPSIL